MKEDPDSGAWRNEPECESDKRGHNPPEETAYYERLLGKRGPNDFRTGVVTPPDLASR